MPKVHLPCPTCLLPPTPSLPQRRPQPASTCLPSKTAQAGQMYGVSVPPIFRVFLCPCMHVQAQGVVPPVYLLCPCVPVSLCRLQVLYDGEGLLDFSMDVTAVRYVHAGRVEVDLQPSTLGNNGMQALRHSQACICGHICTQALWLAPRGVPTIAVVWWRHAVRPD
jgi:hypothetical protein